MFVEERKTTTEHVHFYSKAHRVNKLSSMIPDNNV